jgi:hypothetical protein
MAREPERTSSQRRQKSCVRCEQAIPDGRWIQTDGSGVLCERCWKNMYLPKVRAGAAPRVRAVR